MNLKLMALGAMAAAALAGTAAPASASTVHPASEYPAGKAILGGIGSSHYCDGSPSGAVNKGGSTSLTYGTFTANFCVKGYRVYTATDNYHKTGGTRSSLAFTWEITGSTRQHTTPFSAVSGETWGAQGRYSGGIAIPSGHCVRGVLVQGSSYYYTSNVWCH